MFNTPFSIPLLFFFFFLTSLPADFAFFTCAKEIQLWGKDTNQRMVALWRQAQQVPKFVVTWSRLARGPQHRGGDELERRRASGDVKFDLWKDEMAGDQRAGAGWKGLGAGWNNAANGEYVEEKWMRWGMRESEGSGGRQGGWGGGYHGKFCSFDWSAEREPSYIMYIMDPEEISIHIK